MSERNAGSKINSATLSGFYDHLKRPEPEVDPEIPTAADIVVDVQVETKAEPKKAANRRKGTRYPVDPELMMRGRCGEFGAQVIDMSRSGALLQITDLAYYIDVQSLEGFEKRVATHFGTGVCLQFTDPIRNVRGKTARVAQHGDAYRVAIQFRMPLQPHECIAFGLGVDDEEPECEEEAVPFASTQEPLAPTTWSSWRA